MSLFRSASFRLTAFYVFIVMIISIGFSCAVYSLSKQEISSCMTRPTLYVQQLPPENRMHSAIEDLERIKLEQLTISNGRLISNLIRLNLLILILSTVAGYFFARRTLRPIEEMVEAQSRFTADASHELKTPLTAMKSEIEVTLRDKKLGSYQAKELLESNLEEIGKLEALSKALLELASYEKKSDKSFKHLSLTEIITAAYEKVEKASRQKSIEFDTDFKDLHVLGDSQSLTGLFVILLDNAVKYSKKESKIFISTKKEMRHCEISIRDEGIGISKEDLPHIFDRFYRADTSRTKDKIAGYGLGLAIAKQIAELHNGSICAESKVGKGTIFTVKLPLA